MHDAIKGALAGFFIIPVGILLFVCFGGDYQPTNFSCVMLSVLTMIFTIWGALEASR